MNNDLTALILLIAGAVVLGAVIIAAVRWSRLKRSTQLREHFGPEYERLLAEHGSRDRAERELLARQKRRDALDIHPLSEAQCDQFSAEWGRVQQLFVDDPNGAVLAADALVQDVMRARGYPNGDFDQRVSDLSVEHSSTIEHYRSARKLAVKSEHGTAETEDLRKALVHFRALFSDLLQTEAVKREVRPVATQRLSHV
ncbi:MAG TPA: hypothetical protein VFX59_17940 [Polyangiales bacterium]|nr:hypothetical protein [Polyangiales bacterium]